MSISTPGKRSLRLGLIAAAVALVAALTAGVSPNAWADPAVRPNPDELIVTSVTASSGTCSEVCSGGAARESGAALPHDPRPRSVAVPSLYNESRTVPTVVRIPGHNGGFRWDDAGIGAAFALVVVGLGVAGACVGRPARGRRSRGERATVHS
jgi:hypothetical protein